TEATPVGVRARVGLADGIAVNLADAFESRLESREIPLVGVERTGGATGRPREIWPWFVMAGGLVLTIEWIVFARRMSP
ncbi:MAG: hypothetical protein KDA28_07040, partial [Phycisphaerales bacterium]|nr:hypothetical protein [Phycisphaerales bacterium]